MLNMRRYSPKMEFECSIQTGCSGIQHHKSTLFQISLSYSLVLDWPICFLWLFSFFWCSQACLANFVMTNQKEQSLCRKFCFLFEKTNLKTDVIFREAFQRKRFRQNTSVQVVFAFQTWWNGTWRATMI